MTSREAHPEHAPVVAGHRYYSPELARWVSRDPVGERGGINVYAYILNAPTGGIDPLGRHPTLTNCKSFPYTLAAGGGLLGYWSVNIQVDVVVCDCCYDTGEYKEDQYVRLDGHFRAGAAIGAGLMWDVTATLPDAVPAIGGGTYTWSVSAAISTTGWDGGSDMHMVRDCSGSTAGAVCFSAYISPLPFSGTVGIGGIAQLRATGEVSLGVSVCLQMEPSYRLSGSLNYRYTAALEYRLLSGSWRPVGGVIGPHERPLVSLFDVPIPW